MWVVHVKLISARMPQPKVSQQSAILCYNDQCYSLHLVLLLWLIGEYDADK